MVGTANQVSVTANATSGVYTLSLPATVNVGNVVANTLSVNGITIDPSGATTNQVLKFDGTSFVPGSDTGLAGTTYASTIGDGSSTTFTLTHSLGTRDVVVVARNAASPYEVIDVRWEASTTSTVTLDFSSAPSSNSVRVAVYAAVAGSTITISSIDDLGDVSISNAANGDFLRYNGSNWINEPVNLSTDTVGDYVANLTAGTGITISNAGGEGSNATIAVTANTYDAYGAASTAQTNAENYAANLVANVATSFEVAADSGSSKTITSGSDTLTISGGTGLSTATSNTDTVTVNLDNTAVTSGNYGNASAVATFTVDAQGRLTAASNSNIAITASQITDLSTAAVTSLTGTANEVAVSAANGSVTVGLPDDVTVGNSLTVGSDLTVTGNLTVNGNTTTLNTETLAVEDNKVLLNSNVTGSPTADAGLEVERGTSTNVELRWNETADKWQFTNDGSSYVNIASNTDVSTAYSNATSYTDNAISNVNNTIANIATSFTVAGDSGSNQTITSGSDTLTIAGGTGLSSVSGATDTITINLDDTSVTAGSYGNANTIPSFTVDAQGRLTAASSNAVSILASQVSDFTANVRNQISVSGDLAYNASTGVISFTNDAGDIESVTAGTGLSGGGSSGNVTIDLANTTVTAGNYGAANSVATFTVDAQGRLTAAASTSISITGSQISDLSSVAVTSLTGTANEVEVSAANGAVTIGLPSNVTIGQDLTVTGNLTVSGNTTTLNTETINVEDNIIVLNSTVTGSPTLDAGIEVERGTSNNAVFKWNETDDKWQISSDGTTFANVATTDDVAAVSITALDEIGDVSITSASDGQFLKWNGTAWVNDAIDLGTDTTGNYMSGVTAGTGITVTHTPGEGSNATIAVTANTYDAYGAASNAYSNATSYTDNAISNVNNTISNIATSFTVAGDSGSNQTITSGSDTLTIAGGTGLSTAASNTDTITVSLDNTAVTAGNYGSANSVATFTVDAQGRLTAASDSSISILASQVSDLSSNAVTSLTGTANEIEVSASAGAITIGLPANVTIGQDLTVTGNLTVSGNTTTLNTETLAVEDNFIVLNSNVTGSPSLNAGLTVERGTSANSEIRWNEATDTWQISSDSSSYSNIASGNFVSNVTAGTGVTITNAGGEGANPTFAIGQSVGTSDSVTFGNTTVTNTMAAGAITLDSGTGELNTSTQVVSVNTITTVDSFDKTAYRTAKYLIQVTQGSKYTSSEVLLVHDGTTSYMSEYAVIELGASRIPLAVSTSISSDNVLLRVTVTDAASTNATVKVARTLIAV